MAHTMRTKDKANNMVLNRGSSRRELARVGIYGNNEEDWSDNKNKNVNKNGKENKDEAGGLAVLPFHRLITSSYLP